MILLDFPSFWNDVFLTIPSSQGPHMVWDNSTLGFHVSEPVVIMEVTLYL